MTEQRSGPPPFVFSNIDNAARQGLLCLCAALGATATKPFCESLVDYLKMIFNKTDLDGVTEELLMQMIQTISPSLETKVK